ncbi:MAG: FAD-dependent oxidoreductase, partial [Planctomycetaceae bacterium]
MNNKSTTLRLGIAGMTCDHCATKAEAALNALPGVTARVSFANGMAEVETDLDASVDWLLDALAARGFRGTLLQGDGESAVDEGGGSRRIAIIGTGSGAFAAAVKAAERGASVTLIERSDIIGGTCVNVGCVPSKIMIRSAQLAQMQRRNPFDGLGDVEPAIDRKRLLAQQTARVEELRAVKYESILESNEAIRLIRGVARFQDKCTVRVVQPDGSERTIRADRFLIATGSSPAVPDIPGLPDTPFWDSTAALFDQAIPDRLIVIGSSVVAVELSQAYRRLGSEVTLLARKRLLSREDPALGEGLRAAFEREGIRVLQGTRASRVDFRDGVFRVAAGETVLTGDALLVATGRP